MTDPSITIGNIWHIHQQGGWICIPVCGTVRHNRNLVMGRGLAKDASEWFPMLPASMGEFVMINGNVPRLLQISRIITFPTKHHWYDDSDLNLIKSSWSIILQMVKESSFIKKPVYSPLPGCGCGNLKWSDVWTALEPNYDPALIQFIKLPED